MAETLRDTTGFVGIKAAPSYTRRESFPQTEIELVCAATLVAVRNWFGQVGDTFHRPRARAA